MRVVFVLVNRHHAVDVALSAHPPGKGSLARVGGRKGVTLALMQLGDPGPGVAGVDGVTRLELVVGPVEQGFAPGDGLVRGGLHPGALGTQLRVGRCWPWLPRVLDQPRRSAALVVRDLVDVAVGGTDAGVLAGAADHCADAAAGQHDLGPDAGDADEVPAVDEAVRAY